MSNEKRESALIQNTAPASNQNTENGNRKSKMKTCTSCGREYAKKSKRLSLLRGKKEAALQALVVLPHPPVCRCSSCNRNYRCCWKLGTQRSKSSHTNE